MLAGYQDADRFSRVLMEMTKEILDKLATQERLPHVVQILKLCAIFYQFLREKF